MMPRRPTPFPTISLVKSCLKGRSAALTSIIIIVLVATITEMAIPLSIRLFVDNVHGQTPTFWIWKVQWLEEANVYIWVPVMLVSAAMIRWPINYLRAMTQAQLGQDVLKSLRKRIYKTIQNLSFRYHDQSHSGTLISNLVEDVRYATLFFENGATAIIETLIFIPVVYIIMFGVCWQAALASLGLLLLSFLVIGGVYYFSRPVYARSKELYAETVQCFSEDMEGQLVVRAYGQHAQQYDRYKKLVTTHQKTILQEYLLGFLKGQFLVMGTVTGIIICLYITWVVEKPNLQGSLGGVLLLMFTLQQSLTGKVRMLGRGIDLAIRFQITAQRLHTLFDDTEFLDYGEIEHGETIPHGNLELRNVSFGYTPQNRALDNVSLTIHPGEMIGLVGGMGSGKSSLIHIMCRFYDPDQGKVLLRGHDLRSFSSDGIRSQFAIVFQESFLFSASVRDNISYGWPDVKDEDVERVARIAQAHEFIMAMPEGYDTEVGEKGVSLSGGQRQRLAIARALLQQPRVLVLDDCTSALDNQTEAAILEHLSQECGEMSVILISHRISSVAKTQRIYVLDKGALVEEGTPASLTVDGTHFNRIMTGGDDE